MVVSRLHVVAKGFPSATAGIDPLADAAASHLRCPRKGGQMPELSYRRAVEADLPAIIALLADDILGSSRESRTPEVLCQYRDAFAEI